MADRGRSRARGGVPATENGRWPRGGVRPPPQPVRHAAAGSQEKKEKTYRQRRISHFILNFPYLIDLRTRELRLSHNRQNTYSNTTHTPCTN
jgi:hypothetical protein